MKRKFGELTLNEIANFDNDICCEDCPLHKDDALDLCVAFSDCLIDNLRRNFDILDEEVNI